MQELSAAHLMLVLSLALGSTGWRSRLLPMRANSTGRNLGYSSLRGSFASSTLNRMMSAAVICVDRQSVSQPDTQPDRQMDTDISRSQSACPLVQLTARGRGVSIRIISPEFPLAFSWYGCPKVSVSNMWLKMLLTSCLSLPRVVHMSVVTWILCQVERGRTSGRGR